MTYEYMCGSTACEFRGSANDKDAARTDSLAHAFENRGHGLIGMRYKDKKPVKLAFMVLPISKDAVQQ